VLRSLFETHSTNLKETTYLSLCAGLKKSRYSLCYSLDTETPSLLQSAQVQAKKHLAPTGFSSGDELVKKARTGSLADICDVKLQYSLIFNNSFIYFSIDNKPLERDWKNEMCD
jgi:hypothetical protein